MYIKRYATGGLKEHKFDFLFEHDSPGNVYYRWRTYSLAQGDNLKQWRTQPFQIYTNGGKLWVYIHTYTLS